MLNLNPQNDSAIAAIVDQILGNRKISGNHRTYLRSILLEDSLSQTEHTLINLLVDCVRYGLVEIGN